MSHSRALWRALVVNRPDLFDMFGAVEAFDVDPRNAKIALTTVQGVFEPPPKDGADNALEAGPRIRAEQEPCADRVRQPCSDLAAKLQLPDARDQSLIVRTTEEVGRSLTVGSLISFATISSYCAMVLIGSLAFMCTSL